jgi:hypothetical protein
MVLTENFNNDSALIHEINYLRNQNQKQAVEIKELKAKFESTPFEKFKKANNRGKKYFKRHENTRPQKEHDIWLFLLTVNELFINIGLTISDIKICESNRISNNAFSFSITQLPSSFQMQSISKVLFFKEILFISDTAYNIFVTNLLFQAILPSIHYVRKFRLEMDRKILLKKVGFGLFVRSIEERIQLQLKSFLDRVTSPEFPNIVDDTLLIMHAADGTLISRRVSTKINVAFVIINEIVENMYAKKKPLRLGGLHAIGLIESKESYELLKEPFKFMNDAFINLEREGFNHNNKHYNIKMVFGADMSLAAKAQGITAAHSDNPCVLCTIHKNEFFNVSEHAIKQNNPDLYPHHHRTSELCDKILTKSLILPKKNVLGFTNYKLFPDFDYDRYVSDTLHMLCRIVNILIIRFTRDLIYLDRYDGTSQVDFKKHKRIGRLFEFFKQLKLNVRLIHNDKSQVFASLDGEDCLKLIKSVKAGRFQTYYAPSDSNSENDLDAEDVVIREWVDGTFHTLFNKENNPEFKYDNSDNPDLNIVEMIWEEFYNIYELILSNEITVNNLQSCTNQWTQMYSFIYMGQGLTPYMHLFYGHLHEIFEKYGNIHLFNLQSKFDNNILT